MDILIYIKRLVLARKIVITYKAADEMEVEGITEDDMIESILSRFPNQQNSQIRQPFPCFLP